MDRDRKILVFGSEGQLGYELIQLLSQRQWNHLSIGRRQLDLIDSDAIKQVIRQYQPTIIINCAAYTAVDRAEKEPDLAMKINRDAPMAIAMIAQEIDSYFIHISTDYVFDGCNHLPYHEKDLTHSASIYGKSKLAGEEEIIEYCDKHIIIRTAWVYGCHGKGNFVKTMVRLGAEREEIKVVYDQIGSPTWTKDLAQAIISIVEKISPEISGIYHYTNSGVCSWYDLAVITLLQAKQLGFPITVKNIVPIPSIEYPTPAQRPHYSVLSSQKISNLLGTHPPHWQKSLNLMLQEYAKYSTQILLK